MSEYDKRDSMILSLEGQPEEVIVWVVYNRDMVKGVRDRFIELRGESFVKEYVEVVSSDGKGFPVGRGRLYFDPAFYDHLGNGSQ